MPLLRPREGDNDGGYAVADYRSVRPDLGTMDDLEGLAEDLHGAGMSLVLDLVLNHVAREHEWAETGARRRPGIPRVLPRLPRPHGARRLRANPARGLPRLRPRQLHLGRRARGLGVDDVQRVPVGRQLGEPRGAARVRLDHPRPRQPRGRRAAARRHRVHVEAARHRLPGRAGGARHHPGAARRDPDRVPGGGVPRRGDRGARPSCSPTSGPGPTPAR